MRNESRKVPITIKDHAIRPGTASAVNRIAIQNRELIVRRTAGQIKAFIVVVLVRVLAGTLRLAGLVEGVALLEGGVDVGLPVAGAGAGFDAGLALREEGEGAGREHGWEGEDGGEGQESGGKNLGSFVSLGDRVGKLGGRT